MLPASRQAKISSREVMQNLEAIVLSFHRAGIAGMIPAEVPPVASIFLKNQDLRLRPKVSHFTQMIPAESMDLPSETAE